MANSETLQYFPFSSVIEPSFWHKLYQVKLDVDKLEEKITPVWGKYSHSNTAGRVNSRPVMTVDCSSFNGSFEGSGSVMPAYGKLLIKNSLEDFKASDKVKLLDECGQALWADIESGRACENPALLNAFFLLSYVDLKKYHFYYWFAFPAVKMGSTAQVSAPRRLHDVLSQEELVALEEQVNEVASWERLSCFTLRRAPLRLLALGELGAGGLPGFCDPSTAASPGWPVRNLLALLARCHPHLVGKRVEMVGLRLTLEGRRRSTEASMVWTVVLPTLDEGGVQWVGWERNERGRYGPRFANLCASMDPAQLVSTSVDLNLKLMKWRLVPELDLEAFKSVRCLLLGAGTLGCAVARLLLAWGVQHITFVDNGRVSYSNPVRQSLYTYRDCVKEHSSKAVIAAEALREINPGVVSEGITLTIPMPGHPIGPIKDPSGGDTLGAAAVRADFDRLVELVGSHDVVFLLTDSREARWLPTALAASKDKLAINVALGFDTYLVMRHGPRGAASRLGCYFCNDVTAPGDSQKDRTVDQKCTVTRPGAAAVAAGLAVELLAAVLQHPLRGAAPAEPSDERGVLGPVPHSLRGFLSEFRQMALPVQRFDRCIACSEGVLGELEARGFEFLHAVLDEPGYLERLTGLAELRADFQDTDVWDLSDSDGEETVA
ncbi:ubiquitin-like modifier-activating enzyme ATG7 [Bacillus rossius redtenbacheri]|uniref:ubiquitin-like modifier-activating enzyme ATG7 n=1 Tax=Bacillus rossius redtenbacheri TaxID=93214 RepID=UPI002FDECAD2